MRAAPLPAHDQQLRCGLVVRSLDAGGLEQVVSALARGLDTHRMTTEVLCVDGGGAVANLLATAGVSVTEARGSRQEVERWLRRFKPDVVSTHFLPLDVTTLLAGASPVVDTIHSTYVWLSDADWTAERNKQALAKAVVAVSSTVADHHSHRCGRHPKLSVIPPGVDEARFRMVPRAVARQSLNLEPDALVLVQVGRFCDVKNQHGLVDALSDTLNSDSALRLLLVGPIDDTAYVRRTQASIANLRSAQSVSIRPAINDVSAVYAAADAFISNSLFEGWGLAATEALWCGRPVIHSDCGGARELIGGQGERGFLVPLTSTGGEANAEAIRAAVHQIAARRSEWRLQEATIRQVARERWSAERMVRRHAEVLRSVLC